MPRRAPHPCNHPGCGQLTQGRFCDPHEKQHQQAKDARRGTSARRGYDGRWRAARDAYLALNPLCVQCQRAGRVVAATVVDHIVPHRGDATLFWDEDNWQSLCTTHHGRKTAGETWHRGEGG